MTSHFPPSDLHRWALRLLRLEGQTDAVDAPTALRIVTESEYVVSVTSSNAVMILGNPSCFITSAVRSAKESRLRDAITDFANSFRGLASSQRRKQWLMLRDECHDFPVLSRWLEQFSPGIDVAEPRLPSIDGSTEFIDSCWKVFLASPRDRIRLRQTFVAKYRKQPEVWKPVASRLFSRDSSYVRHIAPWVRDIFRSDVPDQYAISKFIALRAARAKSNARARRKDLAKAELLQLLTEVKRLVAAIVLIIVVVAAVAVSDPFASIVKRTQNHSVQLKQQRSWNAGLNSFSFQKLPTEVFERMCHEIPGLRESVADSDQLKNLEAFMQTRMPEVDHQIRTRYATKNVGNSSNSFSGVLAADDWLFRLRLLVSSQHTNSSSPHRKEENGAWAPRPERKTNWP